MRKISEIRNPKFEIRNKFKIRMRKYWKLRRPVFFFGRFDFSSVVSDFGFRDSSFPAVCLVPAAPGWAALRAAETGFSLRFSAASRRFEEFVGRGGLLRNEIPSSFRILILRPTNSSPV